MRIFGAKDLGDHSVVVNGDELLPVGVSSIYAFTHSVDAKNTMVPDKTFITAPTQNCACSECQFMKMNTLEKLRDCLLNLSPEVVLPEEIRVKAATPIQRMLELSN